MEYALVNITVDVETGPVSGSSSHALADSFRYLLDDVETPEPLDGTEASLDELTGSKLLNHITGTLNTVSYIASDRITMSNQLFV